MSRQCSADSATCAGLQIAVKPAKPFAFGIVDSTPVFGLPGNPVSSIVSFELLAKPALRAIAGHDADDLGPFVTRAVSRSSLLRPRDGKTHFMQVTAKHDERGVLGVTKARGQGSHQLNAMATPMGLAVVPHDSAIGPGDLVDIIMLPSQSHDPITRTRPGTDPMATAPQRISQP